jgi:hypothetical protein
MTRDQRSRFELEVLRDTKTVLKGYAEVFCRESVSYKTELRRSAAKGAKYSSEVAIYFFDENGLFDVLEFFVYFQGEPAVSKEEITGWLRNNIDDVLRRKSRQRGNW